MIYTFYSYKGGVGRSMALANVAYWLYLQGLRVVMIDWDLEAPGLESFFYTPATEPGIVSQLEIVRSQLGLIDMLLAYRRQHLLLGIPTGTEDSGKTVDHLRKRLPPIASMLHAVHAPDPSDGRALWLLPAGMRAGDRFDAYALAVQSFDWAEFYDRYNGEAYFEWMRSQLLADGLADVVLIDSRTGVTEMSGVCTRQMADVVVSFCGPNEQNLAGIVTMVRSFKGKDLLATRNYRPLEMIVVPTRLDRSEIEDRNKFQKQFRSKLEIDEFVPKVLRRVNATYWDLGIPYVPKYAYSERLAIGDPERADRAEELEDAYRKLAATLAMLSPFGSRLQQRMSEEIQQIQRKSGPIPPRVFVVQPYHGQEKLASELLVRLEKEGIPVWGTVSPSSSVGDAWREVVVMLDQSEFIVLPVTESTFAADEVYEIWNYARRRGICLFPIGRALHGGARQIVLPGWLRDARIYDLDKDWKALVNGLQNPCRATRVPFMAPLVPEYFVPRSAELERMVDVFLDHGKPRPSKVVLWGLAGSGKTVLAAAFCHDERIDKAYADGILWVSLGQDADVKPKLELLWGALSGSQRSFANSEEASRALADVLAKRNCLIVIDDVWSVEQLQPFLNAGRDCAHLIISRRNLGVYLSQTKQIEIGAMTPLEAKQLLAAQTQVPVQDLQSAELLVTNLGASPLAISLAASSVRQRIERGDTVENAFDHANQAFESRGGMVFDPREPSVMSLTQAVEASLAQLTAEERAKLIRLAVRGGETEISLARVGEILELDAFGTDQLCQQFDNLALLEFNPRAGTIRIHPLIRDYLRRLDTATPSVENQAQTGATKGEDQAITPEDAPNPPIKARGCWERLAGFLGILIVALLMIATIAAY